MLHSIYIYVICIYVIYMWLAISISKNICMHLSFIYKYVHERDLLPSICLCNMYVCIYVTTPRSLPAICRWKNKNSLLALCIPLALSIVCILLSMLATDLIYHWRSALSIFAIPTTILRYVLLKKKEISFFMLDMDRFTLIIVIHISFLFEVSVFSRWREKSNCVEQLDIYTAANQFVLDSKPKKHSHMLQLSIKIIPYVELTLVRLNLFPMECTSIIVTTFATTFNSDYLDMFTPRRSSDTDTDLKK